MKVSTGADRRLRFVWLEITGRCQLSCGHCYAESGPAGTNGRMTEVHWNRIVDETAALGAGGVQFIGGEPTLHPALPRLVVRALERGLEVEVFSNLVRVTPELWEVFERPGVRLATSWYSDDENEHAAVTGRSRGHQLTLANIAEARRRGIPLRAGVVRVLDGQRVDGARRLLVDAGVTDVGEDDLRQVGRGVRDREQSVAELCGHCADTVRTGCWRWRPPGTYGRACSPAGSRSATFWIVPLVKCWPARGSRRSGTTCGRRSPGGRPRVAAIRTAARRRVSPRVRRDAVRRAARARRGGAAGRPTGERGRMAG